MPSADTVPYIRHNVHTVRGGLVWVFVGIVLIEARHP